MDGDHASRSAAGRSASSGTPIFKPETYPSMADAGYIALLRPPLRRRRSLAPLASPLDRRHVLARRNHSRVRGRRNRSRGPRRSRPREHRGLDLERRDEPRLPARRRTPALGGLRRLLAHRLAARPALAPPRPRHPRDDRSPTPSTCSSRRTGRTWKARGSTSSGPPRCCSSPRPHGCRTERARDSRSRADRSSPYPAVCALVATGILVYDHFTRVNLLAIVLASLTLAMVIVRLAATFRENRRLFELTRAEATTDSLTGLANRRQLARRSRAPSERRARGADAPHALRPRRLQGLQRQLRAPGGRRAARAARREARHRPGRGRRRVPARWRRVLSHRDGRRRRGGAADRPCMRALSEQGEGFEIGSSFGAVLLPDEATDASQRAAGGGRASLCAEVLAPRRERANDGGAPRGALDPRAGARGAARRRRHAGHRRRRRCSGCAATSSKSSSARPSSTTSGSSPCPTRSSTSPGRSTSASGRSSASRRSSASASSAHPPRCAASRASSARATRTGTAAAIPTVSSARRSPLAARIIRVCNAYVAMISERPYRPALSDEEALNELMRLAGTEYDPTVVRVFVAHVRDEHEAERAA